MNQQEKTARRLADFTTEQLQGEIDRREAGSFCGIDIKVMPIPPGCEGYMIAGGPLPVTREELEAAVKAGRIAKLEGFENV